MRSIRFFSRGRIRSERFRRPRRPADRGFVLVAALVLAILYFMLMQLMLIDASRALAEARRFRAKIVAAALAENGAELAAKQMLTLNTARVQAEDGQGKITASLLRDPNNFRIDAEGVTKGTITARATVLVEGSTSGGRVYINYFRQSQ